MEKNQTSLEKNYAFFMKADLQRHIGEWVAICDQKIVSHGKSAKDVFDEVTRKCPGKRPLFAKVPDKAAMIF